MHTVQVGACRCPEYRPAPGAPQDHLPPTGPVHPDGDWVGMRERLSLQGGLMLSAIMAEGVPSPIIMRGPQEVAAYQAARNSAVVINLLASEIEDWSFVDETGKRVPIAASTIERLLTWSNGGQAVSAVVMSRMEELQDVSPFAKGKKRSSASGPTRRTRKSTTPPSTSPTPTG